MWAYMNTDELYHYGVLGMKWGRRRAKLNNSSSDRKTLRKENKAARKEKRKATLEERKKEFIRMERAQQLEKARIAKAQKVAREKGYLAAESVDAYVKQRKVQIEKGRRAALSWQDRMDEDFARAFGETQGVDGYDYDDEDF